MKQILLALSLVATLVPTGTPTFGLTIVFR